MAVSAISLKRGTLWYVREMLIAAICNCICPLHSTPLHSTSVCTGLENSLKMASDLKNHWILLRLERYLRNHWMLLSAKQIPLKTMIMEEVEKIIIGAYLTRGMMSSLLSSLLSLSINYCFKWLLLQNYLPVLFQTLHNNGRQWSSIRWRGF